MAIDDDNIDSCEVAVIGAGIVGICTAYTLAKRGHDVVVYEAEAKPARITSFANGGLITPSMAEPWAAPGLPGKLLSWMGREDAPFLIRPGNLPGMTRWGLRFLRNCTQAHWERNTRRLVELAKHSQRCLNRVADEAGLSNLLTTSGGLRIYANDEDGRAVSALANAMRRFDIASTERTQNECLELEPILQSAKKKVAGGVYYPDDQAGDCRKFTQELATVAETLGARFRYSNAVRNVQSATDSVTFKTASGTTHCEKLIVATGFPPNTIRGLKKAALPICYPVKGYSVSFAAQAGDELPTVPIIDDSNKIGIVPIENGVRLVGTAEFAGTDARISEDRVQAIIDTAQSLLPHDWLRRKPDQVWTAFRPMMPDSVPVIGRSKHKRILLNVGHGHLGWTNACGSADLIADLVANREPVLDMSDYSSCPQDG